MTESINFQSLPEDDDGWRKLADQLAEVGDIFERHFLELKSDVPLDNKESWGKVAKYVLGASNRNPSFARTRFTGHAVMLLGVKHGAVDGIPSFEPKDLLAYVKKITGHPGPGWRFETIPLTNGNFLTVIIVDPPIAGKRPNLCYSDGTEGLKRSEIYIRVDGETRVATADEKMEMIEEAKASRPQTKFQVEVIGSACAYRCDVSILEDYIARTKARLISAYPEPKSPFRATSPNYSFASLLESSGITSRGLLGESSMEQPDARSREDYLAEIEKWAVDCRTAWPKMLKKLAAVVVPAISVKITNLSETYLEDVRCTVHIEGPVSTTRKDTSRSFSPVRKLPNPPRKWGPTKRDFLSPAYNAAQMFSASSIPPGSFDVLGHKNVRSFELKLALDKLPPEDDYQTPDDERILILDADPAEVTELHGTWKITAKDHHQSYRGEVVVAVEARAIRDFSTGVRQSLLPDSAE